jgi:hypothetical protein
MVSRVNQICGFGDHFWYPEMQKQIAELSKKAHDPDDLKVDEVKVDLAKFFQKRPDTFLNDLTVFVLKILHQLKLYFSSSYKSAFNRSVEVLNDAVQARAKLVRDRFIVPYKLKKVVHRSSIERRERLNKGKELIGKLRKNIKAQKDSCEQYKIQIDKINSECQKIYPKIENLTLEKYEKITELLDDHLKNKPLRLKVPFLNEKEKNDFIIKEQQYRANLAELDKTIEKFSSIANESQKTILKSSFKDGTALQRKVADIESEINSNQKNLEELKIFNFTNIFKWASITVTHYKIKNPSTVKVC